ncbi:Uncharacterized protein F383_27484 [Gossypium arboreum]|uniref:Uncharacterized protein n=1 Tax=Gossypium arboreum TaxID=29729 RepID=A0A0B0P8W1_GOSAR|nr:Uncharacterized protein F383_27484 [Gossypium arboreum]
MVEVPNWKYTNVAPETSSKKGKEKVNKGIEKIREFRVGLVGYNWHAIDWKCSGIFRLCVDETLYVSTTVTVPIHFEDVLCT